VRQKNSGAVEVFIFFTVFRCLSTNPKVKELLKSVYFCQSYRQNKNGTIFMAHGVYCLYLQNKEVHLHLVLLIICGDFSIVFVVHLDVACNTAISTGSLKGA